MCGLITEQHWSCPGLWSCLGLPVGVLLMVHGLSWSLRVVAQARALSRADGSWEGFSVLVRR